ncbi:ATP-binding cassette domain-containing protein [Shinella curvata]|uniref:ATP-binding cassette domain-containing protein n=1 Tax=Shinella curvata TaxID=1817964 RepID=A0ABT8XJU9_9HYPH|nr:ATP-binding cassette domain-containing protein [Shinella curvata]MCJ8055853.1 ATP-binding cassette domain-containing protein [Shinella curvata]MDO6123546.1 ATP-binding cassette domain-containing protein [Shinella curvata]
MLATTHPQSGMVATSRIHRVVTGNGGAAPSRGDTVELTVSHLTKRYGETLALSDASVTFKPGIHTILGENGSGKSTMLKILSGVVSPSEGTIALNGRAISPRTPHDMHELGLSTVFQEVLIAPHRTVVENIFLGYDGPLRRRIEKSARAPLAQALLAEISRFPIPLSAPAGELPLASQQLIVLARALVRLPSILLLDEATAALDYADRDLVFDAIENYAAAGNIVIFISHRLEEVRRLSDRVTVLRSGHIVETLERDGITAERLLKLMAPEAAIHA